MLPDTLPNEPGAADLEQRSHRKQQDRSGDTHHGTSAFVTDQPRLLSYQFTGIDAARRPGGGEAEVTTAVNPHAYNTAWQFRADGWCRLEEASRRLSTAAVRGNDLSELV